MKKSSIRLKVIRFYEFGYTNPEEISLKTKIPLELVKEVLKEYFAKIMSEIKPYISKAKSRKFDVSEKELMDFPNYSVSTLSLQEIKLSRKLKYRWKKN